MISSSLSLMFYNCRKLSNLSELPSLLPSLSLSLSYFRKAVTFSAYKDRGPQNSELNDTVEYSDFCTPIVSISGSGKGKR